MGKTNVIHTDVERAGDLSSVKLQSHQVARLGIMSQPEGHAQDHTSCKLQVQTVSSENFLAIYLFRKLCEEIDKRYLYFLKKKLKWIVFI